MQLTDMSSLIPFLSLLVALFSLLGSSLGTAIANSVDYLLKKRQHRFDVYINFLDQASNINFGQAPKDEVAYSKAYLELYSLSSNSLRAKLHIFNQHVIGTKYIDAALMLEDITADLSHTLKLLHK